MKVENWEYHIEKIVIEKDTDAIKLLAQLIYESEEAKNVLREKGYGWTGLSLLETVKTEVPSAG